MASLIETGTQEKNTGVAFPRVHPLAVDADEILVRTQHQPAFAFRRRQQDFVVQSALAIFLDNDHIPGHAFSDR